jgi:hypothetical protein
MVPKVRFFLFLLKIAAIHPAICDIADESIGHVIASLIWY